MENTDYKTGATLEYEDGSWYEVPTVAFLETVNNQCASTLVETEGNPSEFQLSDFGFFSLPIYIAILGIEIEVTACMGGLTGKTGFVRLSISYDDGAHWSSTKQQQWTPNESQSPFPKYFGSSSDLWGYTWLPGNLANGIFRLKAEVWTYQGGGGQSPMSIDCIKIKVYYVHEFKACAIMMD